MLVFNLNFTLPRHFTRLSLTNDRSAVNNRRVKKKVISTYDVALFKIDSLLKKKRKKKESTLFY